MFADVGLSYGTFGPPKGGPTTDVGRALARPSLALWTSLDSLVFSSDLTRQCPSLTKDVPLDFIRPAIRAMRGYVPGEQPQDGGYIKLQHHETSYPPSPLVREAIERCAHRRRAAYPDPMANVLRDSAAARYDLTRDHILAGNGSDELLTIVLRACAGEGDRVAYPTPTYSLYDTLVAIAGATPVRVPFSDDFSLPAALADAGARVTFVCNPNAPSGTFIAVDELAGLSEQVAGLLVIDEAYVDFAGTRRASGARAGQRARVAHLVQVVSLADCASDGLGQRR